MSIKEEGYKAYWDKHWHDRNPYEAGTSEYQEWRDGWGEANSDDIDMDDD